jgi:hypothetical protein
MEWNKKILLSIIFIFLINGVLAVQPTQNFNKLFLSPFYLPSTTQNIENTFLVNLNPPDKISNVLSAMISFDVWLNPSINFTLKVNNQKCSNPEYYISTTYAGAGKNQVSFDCSNVIKQSGNYTIILKANKDTGAMTGFLDLTYMNNPTGDVTVHGTEYSYGQQAKVWLQLLDSNGSTISNGICFIDIFNPTNTNYLEQATMTNMNHEGIYYYDLGVPMMQGVYPVIASCYYTAGQTSNYGSTITMSRGTLDSGSMTNTKVLDGSYMVTTESPSGEGNPRRYTSIINFTSGFICSNISELLLTGITISWTGRWNSNVANDIMTILIWNYTSNKWIPLANTITGSGTGVKSVSNSFSFTNITQAGFVNSSGSNLRLKFNDTELSDTTSSGFDYDYLSVDCNQLISPQWQEVKGSSELHVTSPLAYLEELQSDAYTINTTQVIELFNGTNITDIYYTGIFKHSFSISSGTVSTEQKFIEYQGLHSIPCDSVIGFYYTNSTGKYAYPYKTQRQTDEDHCSVNFYLNLSQGQLYDFEVYYKNVWESEIRSTNTGVNAISPLLESGCLLWQMGHGYPNYIIPKNITNLEYDYYYMACANWHDNFYWFNKSYFQSLIDRDLISDRATYLQYEANYVSLDFLANELNSLTTSLLNNLGTVASYSKLILDNPLGNLTNLADQKVWANFSTQYQNWILLNASCGTGVCNINGTQINVTPSTNITQIAQAVWNYNSRNLSFIEDTVNYTLISQMVWQYNGERNLTFYQTNNLTASDIWGFASRELTNSTEINYSRIAYEVWNWTSRDLTSFDFVTNSSLNFTEIANAVWLNPERNLTFYETTSINNTEIAIEVWQFNNRSLSYYQLNNLTAQEIWEYQNRNLTETQDMTNYSLIGNLFNYSAMASSVWGWTGGISSSILGFFTTDIWSYVNRTLSPSEYDKIAVYVWNYSGDRNLTFYEINNISPQDIWQYTSRNLTFTEDVYDYNLSAQTNWNYVDRNLTMYPIGNNLTVSDIWAYYNRSLSENIPLQVWSYQNRNLTTDLPFEVWSYSNRTLTYYTLNITELIEMLSNYNMTQISIPFPLQNNQYPSNSLNVILYVQK